MSIPYYLNKRIVTLIAPSFEEGFTVYCMDRMRDKKLPASLIGISKGIIRGYHGVCVQPDFTLNQIDHLEIGMVIIPGSRSCASRLLSDPRVHRLLDSTIANGGYIAASESAQSIVTTIGMPQINARQHLLRQGTLSIPDFAQKLIDIWEEPLLSPNGHLRSVPLM